MIDEGSIIKDWRHVDLTFGLIYPNSYKLANSSYTIRLLYHIINIDERFLCERIFLPEKIVYPAANDNSPKNLIRSLENKVLPTEFDVLGVSVHYENDFKNILWLLDKANIPLHREERKRIQKKQDVIYPLLIAGGPVITSNPLPLSDIFDLFFIGDSENTLIPFFEQLINWKLGDRGIEKLVAKNRKLTNIFIPAINNHPKRGVLERLEDSPNPVYQTISKSKNENTIFERNFFIEVNRGCPFQCKFCISSFHNSPFRNRSYANIIQLIDVAIKATKFEKISLIGSCVSSHPKFKEICEYIIKKGKKLSIPSIRLDHLTEELINLFEKANMNSITLAPETGSEPLRFELGKKISNQKILEIATKIFNSSIRYLKLYFLLGLPSESENDIKNIIILLKELDEIGFERGGVKVNINPFIPKLNTPYGNYVDNYLNKNFDDLISKSQKVNREIRKIRAIKLKFQHPKDLVKEAKLQTLFSLGDTQFSSVLIEYYRNGAKYSDLEIAEKKLGYSTEKYLKKIQQGYSPWKI
jgi:radical SAM superfamily enzyme YgiQ (UPF0313 family)